MPNSATYIIARTAIAACTHSDGTVCIALPIATNSVCSQVICDGNWTDTAGESSGVESHVATSNAIFTTPTEAARNATRAAMGQCANPRRQPTAVAPASI